MSGIVGSKLNIRGSGLVGSLGTDGQHLLSAGAGVTNVFETAEAGGITMADQWRLHTSFTGDASPIASNLEQVDTDGFGAIGSAMTESSGIFTFPSTGVYLIQAVFQAALPGDDRVIHGNIDTTTDDSSYDTAAGNSTFIQQTSSNNTYATSYTSFMFDVTDTSTHKCKFLAISANQSTVHGGSSGSNGTFFTFIRLGDT